jgi:hypothetical protein
VLSARMSLLSWYEQKANQCAQMAKVTPDPLRRSEIEEERRLWLQIAEGEKRRDAGHDTEDTQDRP